MKNKKKKRNNKLNNISFFFYFLFCVTFKVLYWKEKDRLPILILNMLLLRSPPSPPHNTSAFLAGSCYLLYSTVGRNSLAVTRECVTRIADGWEERILYYVCVCAFRSLPLPSPQLYVVAVVLGGGRSGGFQLNE